MPTSILSDGSLVFGAASIKPIMDLPQDAERVRIRIRPGKLVLVFVKTPRGIFEYAARMSGDAWAIGTRPRAANLKQSLVGV
jgi:hypothetical protein